MKKLKYWQKGIIIGLCLWILFYILQVAIMLYKDYIFSSFDKKAGFMYFYSLPDVKTMILMLVFFVIISGVIGFIIDFKKQNL